MAICKFKHNGMDFQFSDKDICQNPGDMEFSDSKYHSLGEPYKYFFIHEYGFCVAMVCATNLQDALDIAVDNDKLDSFLIGEKDYKDYDVRGNNPTCTFLGNAGEPFDIDSLQVIELPIPKFSLAGIFTAHFEEGNAK